VENSRHIVENFSLGVESLGKGWGKVRRKIRIVTKSENLVASGRGKRAK
jgi:hypothetical protein